MAYSPILRSDLQDLLDKYVEMRDKISALHLFSAQQQISLEFERKQSEKIKNKLQNVVCYLMEHKDQHKVSLNNLEKENNELKCTLADVKRERDRAELSNNVKVSTLQNEVDFLRLRVTQLEDKHREQERHHKDEISKYKHLLENEQNVKKRNKSKITENHPAFINEESTTRKWSVKKKSVPEEWSSEIVHKKRRLFQEDKEATIDII
nr:PREDICTED: sodium channel and clathrin linker 1-like isoform X2 [Linepithema humile]